MKKLIYKDESRRGEITSRMQHGIGEGNHLIDAYNKTTLAPLRSIDELRELRTNPRSFICEKAVGKDIMKNVNATRYFELLTVQGIRELENTIKGTVNVSFSLDYAVFKNGKLEIDKQKLDQELNQCDVYAEGVGLEVYEAIQTIRQKFDALNSLTNLRWRDIGTLYTENNYSHELIFNLNQYGQLCKEAVKKDGK